MSFKSINEAAKFYIERDILVCDSSLISDLLNRQNQANNPTTEEFCYDNVENLYDYSPSTIDEYLEENRETDTFADCFANMFIDSETLEDLTADEKNRLAVAMDFDAGMHEIYEWYRCNEWIAGKLQAQGEPILSNAYGKWWGRTCTGQDMYLDGTFQAIAKEIFPELPEEAA